MTDIVERLHRRASTRNTGREVSPTDSECLGYYSAGDSNMDEETIAEIERIRGLNAEMVWALLEARTDLMIAANNADEAAKTDPRWEGVSSRLRERNRQIDAVLAAEGRRGG